MGGFGGAEGGMGGAVDGGLAGSIGGSLPQPGMRRTNVCPKRRPPHRPRSRESAVAHRKLIPTHARAPHRPEPVRLVLTPRVVRPCFACDLTCRH